MKRALAISVNTIDSLIQWVTAVASAGKREWGPEGREKPKTGGNDGCGPLFVIPPRSTLAKVTHFRLRESDLQALIDLKEKTNAKSISEVIRNALMVYYYFVTSLEKGATIWVEKPTNTPHNDLEMCTQGVEDNA